MNVTERYSLDMSGQTDNSDKLGKMAADVAAIFAAKKPMPSLVFSDGICAFDRWPHLAYSGLRIIADGECVLKHTGAGDAVVFNGPQSYPGEQGGPNDLWFQGFTIETSMKGGHGLIINSCHRSRFDVYVQNTDAPSTISGPIHAAINVIFSILTEIRPRVGGRSGDCIGLAFDVLANRPSLVPTANRIHMPILESCAYGVFIRAGGYLNFYDGTIESCGTGVEIDGGGNNHFMMVEMEGNQWDAVTTDKAHDNLFWYCGEGHPKKFKSNFHGWNNRLVHGPLDGLFGL